MDLEYVITALYALVPLIYIAGWVPQIVRLCRAPDSALAMSLPTWSMWSFSGLVALLYAAVVMEDPLLTLVAAINATGQIVVLIFGVRSRIGNR